MQKLTKLASNEVYKGNKSVNRILDDVSENLNDIQLYLNVNKDKLPKGSEVSIDELFQLLEKIIKNVDVMKDELNCNHKWLKAMTA